MTCFRCAHVFDDHERRQALWHVVHPHVICLKCEKIIMREWAVMEEKRRERPVQEGH